MISREAGQKVLQMAEKFPVIVITGPRQSGKSTMCRHLFSDYRYVSLESPDNLLYAETDPRGFLSNFDKHVIIDEVQRCPTLFSYLQEIVDGEVLNGRFVLTGSQNFLLLEKITQTLAGRVYMLELLPFSQKELSVANWRQAIIKGGYPRLHDQDIAPNDFFPNYIQTYIERDIRSILHVQDLMVFKKFIFILAHHVGQLLNFNKLAKDVGVDSKTLQRWFSVLEASYIVFTLKPWHKNFSRRLVKMPKLYFYDAGLVAHLLGIEDEEELIFSTYKGALFENFGVTEILKSYKNQGIAHPFHFWRDSNGNEIDLVIERGNSVKFIEMKASETVKPEFLKTLHYLDGLQSDLKASHFLFNAIDTIQKRTNETIVGWRDASWILENG